MNETFSKILCEMEIQIRFDLGIEPIKMNIDTVYIVVQKFNYKIWNELKQIGMLS